MEDPNKGVAIGPKQNTLQQKIREMKVLHQDLETNKNKIVKLLQDLSPIEMYTVIRYGTTDKKLEQSWEIWKLTAKATLYFERLSMLEGALLGSSIIGTRVVKKVKEINYFLLMLTNYVESVTKATKTDLEYLKKNNKDVKDGDIYQKVLFEFGTPQDGVQVQSYFLRNHGTEAERQKKNYIEQRSYFFVFLDKKRSSYQESVVEELKKIINTEPCADAAVHNDAEKKIWIVGFEIFVNSAHMKIYNQTSFRLVYRILQVPGCSVRLN